MKVMLLGDIVGAPGRVAARNVIARMRGEDGVGIVLVNAENAAGGRGITPAIADELLAAGADAITLGDHVWDQREILARMAKDTRLVRPLNLPSDCPGAGWHTLQTSRGPLTIVSLLGRVFMPTMAECPFRAMDAFLRTHPASSTGPVVVDVHAEATSEKIALGWYLDGRVSIVAGTHTHVQTSDETILPKGTAYITDLGMTGPKASVIGRTVGSVTRKFLTGMPSKFEVATDDVAAEGVVVEVASTGLARKIHRFRKPA